MEPWRVWRPMFADSHQFVEEQDENPDPNQSKYSDPDLDPHLSEKRYSDPHHSHAHLQLCFSLYQ